MRHAGDWPPSPSRAACRVRVRKDFGGRGGRIIATGGILDTGANSAKRMKPLLLRGGRLVRQPPVAFWRAPCGVATVHPPCAACSRQAHALSQDHAAPQSDFYAADFIFMYAWMRCLTV